MPRVITDWIVPEATTANSRPISDVAARKSAKRQVPALGPSDEGRLRSELHDPSLHSVHHSSYFMSSRYGAISTWPPYDRSGSAASHREALYTYAVSDNVAMTGSPETLSV